MRTALRERIRIRLLAVILWIAVISLFSSIPGSGLPFEPPLWYVMERKLAHVAEFALLAILVLRTLALRFPREPILYRALFAAASVFLVGALDEVHQLFVFGRGARASDVLIDVIGGVAGIAAYAVALGRLRVRSVRYGKITR